MGDNQGQNPVPTEPLDAPTWAALLSRWLDFARAAVALPQDGEGDRWRRSVSPAITLQAVTMALGEVEKLDPQERALARDRASVLIERETTALGEIWGAPLPDRLGELTTDASSALASAQPR